MDLRYDGVYRLTELSTFTLRSSIDDVGEVKVILTVLLKVKRIIDVTASHIENMLKSSRCFSPYK
ncbi:unnamed protein product [Umbelopsis vinacea]